MSDVEFFGKMNIQPFISLRAEEELRLNEIKERLNKAKYSPKVIYTEITYERDVQEDN
jgi:hypothetical protein